MTEVEKTVVETPMEKEEEKPAQELKRPAEETKEAPAAKKAKVVDMAALKKQIEYYFSDMNLSGDAFFHKHISESEGGWLKMQYLLGCKKVQVLGATAEDIAEALKESPLEVRPDAVRRTQALPELKARPSARMDKPKKNPHIGGVIFKVSGIPTGKKWGDVKDVLKVKLPENAKVMFATSVKEEDASTTMLVSPFDGDLEFIQKVELTLEEKALSVQVLYDDDLRKALADMPKHVTKRREQNSRDRTKKMQKPIVLGESKFPNVNALRSKVKEILASRQNGQALRPDAPDYLLVKSVLEFHPRAADKLKGMTGLKVDKHAASDSRCFFVTFDDKEADDISIMKCLLEIERNPPQAPETPKPEEKKEEAKEEPQSPEKEAKKEEAKEEAKTEEPKEVAKEEAKTEEPKADEPKAEVA